LARDLALCIAQGKDFLNRAVVKGNVIYLALEEKRSEVKRHFEDMGIIGDEEIYIHAASAPQNAIAELNELARIHTPRLIIIDPLFRFISVRDGNDYASVTKALEPLVNIARDTSAHVMCVHHLGKGDKSGTDAILGSTAIFAAVDTALILKRTDKYRTIQSTQRYGTDLEESVIEFDTESRTSKISGTKNEAEIIRIGRDIYDYLSTQKESVFEKDIKENIEGTNTYRVKALRNLVDTGKVIRDGKGGKGDPYHYSCSLVPSIYIEQQNKKNLNLTDEQKLRFDEIAGRLEYECNLPRLEAEKQALSEVIKDEKISF
ncbi:MAG: AAA family ATPase, partial [Proteobacteria bacterium]|nr:AAA family ATPase [Pseudomonadota bacterium]